ncbi:MAG: 1-acyl-sn-glycerol-3-phosphate acyltransferase, partial [Moorea sp. SIO3I7]|nr:1-acyl-sn-glycerol-3-phosphate acyltransferase [Moorena sp. SIO3I7]
MSVLSSPQFYAPRLNPLLTRICQSFSDLVADNFYQLKLVVESTDLEKLARLEEERVVYLPNHPTLDDGMVLFLLSTRLGQLFHYVVAYESFRGW